jgi:hypothetical protein
MMASARQKERLSEVARAPVSGSDTGGDKDVTVQWNGSVHFSRESPIKKRTVDR